MLLAAAHGCWDVLYLDSSLRRIHTPLRSLPSSSVSFRNITMQKMCIPSAQHTTTSGKCSLCAHERRRSELREACGNSGGRSGSQGVRAQESRLAPLPSPCARRGSRSSPVTITNLLSSSRSHLRTIARHHVQQPRMLGPSRQQVQRCETTNPHKGQTTLWGETATPNEMSHDVTWPPQCQSQFAAYNAQSQGSRVLTAGLPT